MRIAGDWLERAETQAVLALLEQGGHQALPVGGCVRNALLDQPVADVDIATDALPERVRDLAEAAGMKVVPTGISHGTVTVVLRGQPFEITTFRRDEETDGRHARVRFTDRIAEDAARRDFTMNALYCRADGTLVDPLGGLPDALARRVRFVGLPADRIREDYLRILRFFRFHAWYGDGSEGPDAEGLAACAAFSAGLETLSRERIGAEMRKLMAAPDPAPAVASMAAAGVLAQVLPGADPRLLPVLVHLEDGAAPDPLRRLAALGGEDAKRALRLSNPDSKALDALRQAMGSMDTPAALGWKLGSDRGADAVLLRAAALEQPPSPGWQDEVARGAAEAFPIQPSDLMPEFSGPALGLRLAELERRWLDSDLRIGRDALLQ